MPTLDKITYSREATIAAVRDYYQFLADMFLPEDFIEEPPAEGWPSITKERVTRLGKNDEVFELMRHLPYLPDESQLVARATAANWSSILADHVPMGSAPIPFKRWGVRITTEGLDWEDVPSSAFGLAHGGRNNEVFIFDTQFGTVTWIEAPDFDDNPLRKTISRASGGSEDFEDCTPENEHGWRRHKAWSIVDFFEVLKNELRTLESVPVYPHQIEPWSDEFENRENLDEFDALTRSVRHAYQEHGWPDMSVYNKDECRKAIDKLVNESDDRWEATRMNGKPINLINRAIDESRD